MKQLPCVDQLDPMFSVIVTSLAESHADLGWTSFATALTYNIWTSNTVEVRALLVSGVKWSCQSVAAACTCIGRTCQDLVLKNPRVTDA